MASLESHKNTVKELIDDINEKIKAGLLAQRQKIVGFAASEASTNMFAFFLHKKELISPGFNINHKFFASTKRAKDTFKEVFEEKNKIIEFMVKQEGFRDQLCYGKDKDEKTVIEAAKNLFELKQLLEKILGEEI